MEEDGEEVKEEEERRKRDMAWKFLEAVLFLFPTHNIVYVFKG